MTIMMLDHSLLISQRSISPLEMALDIARKEFNPLKNTPARLMYRAIIRDLNQTLSLVRARIAALKSDIKMIWENARNKGTKDITQDLTTVQKTCATSPVSETSG